MRHASPGVNSRCTFLPAFDLALAAASVKKTSQDEIGFGKEEEQTSPLDLSQMLPGDAMIEVINEEVVSDDFPDLMDDNFLIYSGVFLIFC